MTLLIVSLCSAVLGLSVFLLIAHLTSDVDAANVEEYVSKWLTHIQKDRVRKLVPALPGDDFTYFITLAEKTGITIRHAKESPDSLIFQADVSFGPRALSAFANLSEDRKVQFKINFDAELAKGNRADWSTDPNFTKVSSVGRVSIDGMTEQKFIDIVAGLRSESYSVARLTMPLFVAILPPEVSSDIITKENVREYIQKWAKESDLTIQPIPSDPLIYFGYAVGFSQSTGIGVLYPKEQPDYIAFRVFVRLNTQTIKNKYDLLQPGRRAKLVSTLKDYWDKCEIPYVFEAPFESVVIRRVVAISDLNGLSFFRAVKKINFDGWRVASSVDQALAGELLPPGRYFKLSKFDVEDIESDLILGVRKRIFVKSVNDDSESSKIESDLTTIFKETGYEVTVANIAPTQGAKRGSIVVCTGKEPPRWPLQGLISICSRLNRALIYGSPLNGDNLQVIIGPP